MAFAATEAEALDIIHQHNVNGQLDRTDYLRLAAIVACGRTAHVVVQCHAVAIVVEGLRNHSQDEALVRTACDALQEAFHAGLGREQAADAGGVEAILIAMSRHPANVPVQRCALQTLWQLCGTTGSDLSQARLLASCHFGVVFAAMRQSGDAAALGAACNLLQRLTATAGGRLVVSDMGGTELLLHTMLRHPRDAAIQAAGCTAIRNLALGPVTRPSLRTLGAVDFVIDAMRQLPDDVAVQQAGCSALWQFCSSGADRAHVGLAGGIQAVAIAMHRHPTDVFVQQCGCGLLWKLSLLPANRLRMEALQVEAVVRQALALGVRTEGVRLFGQAVLWRFADSWLSRSTVDVGKNGFLGEVLSEEAAQWMARLTADRPKHVRQLVLFCPMAVLLVILLAVSCLYLRCMGAHSVHCT
eukprot:EG_transcript_5001